MEFPGSVGVKNLVLSLLWPGQLQHAKNFHMPWALPKQKTNKEELRRGSAITNLIVSMRTKVPHLALLSGLRISVASSWGVGHRRGWDPELLRLWCRSAATVLIQPLAWELPHVSRAAVDAKKKKKKKKKQQQQQKKPTSETKNKQKGYK